MLYQNGALATQAETIWTAPTTVQGLGFDGSNLLQVLQSGSTTEYIWTLAEPEVRHADHDGLGSLEFQRR